MGRRRIALLAAAAAAALTMPAAASAKDFCVNGPPGCSGTAINGITLQSWLIAAQTNGSDDRFFIAPGSITGGPWTYNSSEGLEIIGAGADKTTLIGDLPGAVLSASGPDVRVSDLAIKATGNADVGLALSGGRASNVAATNTTGGGVGLIRLAGGATLDHARANATGTIAVVVTSGTATIADSVLASNDSPAVAAAGSDATLVRDRLAGLWGAGVIAGHMSVSDTLVDLRGAPFGAVGLLANPQTASGAALDVDRSTIIGDRPDTADRVGVYAYAAGAGTSATVHATNTVVSDAGVPVARIATAGGSADLTASHDAYGASVVPNQSGPGTLAEDHVIVAAPRFVNASANDFTLRPDSPLIDAGAPAALPPGSVDLAGAPRLTDGDGDCTATVDIGAFERPAQPATCAPAPPSPASPPPDAPAGNATLAAPPQLLAPTIARLRVAPRRVRRGTAAAVRLTLSVPATVRVRVTRQGGGVHPLRVSARLDAGQGRILLARRLRLTPGRYRVTAVATDAAGRRSRTAAARFVVVRP